MQKSDTIHLKNIESFCRLGVFDIEREKGQIIKVDLDVDLDLKASGDSDDLKDTVNYADFSFKVQEIAKAKEYFLVEHLAEEIIKALFLCSELIKAIKIKVHKPTIITEGFSGDVAITLHRSREN